MKGSDPLRCHWCEVLFTPRTTRGPKQKFCSRDHKEKFWEVLRAYGLKKYLTGELSIAALRANAGEAELALDHIGARDLDKRTPAEPQARAQARQGNSGPLKTDGGRS